MRFIGMRSFLALAAAIPSPAAAQMSFSSETADYGPNRWAGRYTGARIYSEDNRDFRLVAHGCAWTLGRQITRERDYYPGRNITPAQDFATSTLYFRQAFERAAGQRMDYMVHLIGGRTVSTTDLRPSNLTCGARAALAFATRNRVPYAYLLYDSGGRAGFGTVGYRMRQNWLSPQQERDAWRFAGDLGLAILQAWFSRR